MEECDEIRSMFRKNILGVCGVQTERCWMCMVWRLEEEMLQSSRRGEMIAFSYVSRSEDEQRTVLFSFENFIHLSERERE